MMKRPAPLDGQVDLVSSDDEAVDMEADGLLDQIQSADVLNSEPACDVFNSEPAGDVLNSEPACEMSFEGT